MVPVGQMHLTSACLRYNKLADWLLANTVSSETIIRVSFLEMGAVLDRPDCLFTPLITEQS